MKAKEKYWKIWDMAQTDPMYRMLYLQLKKLDPEFDRIMMTLPYGDRDMVSDFVSLCEEMSSRMLEVACENMDFCE